MSGRCGAGSSSYASRSMTIAEMWPLGDSLEATIDSADACEKSLRSAFEHVDGLWLLENDIKFWSNRLHEAEDTHCIARLMLKKTTSCYRRQLILSEQKESTASDSTLQVNDMELPMASTGPRASTKKVAPDKTTPTKRPGFWTEQGPSPPEAQSAEKKTRAAFNKTVKGLKLRDQDKAARAEPEDALATAAAREDTAVPPPRRRRLDLLSRKARSEVWESTEHHRL